MPTRSIDTSPPGGVQPIEPRPEVRLLVCGGRDYSDRARVFQALDTLMVARQITVLIHGGATGADSLAAAWAEDRAIATMVFPVNKGEWRLLGNKAGPLRNERMLRDGRPTAVVALPGGRGTDGMCKLAEAADVPVWRPYG